MWCNGNKLEVIFDVKKPSFLEYKRRAILNSNNYMHLPLEYTKYDYLETIGYNTKVDTGVAGNDTTLQFTGEIELRSFTSYGALFGNNDPDGGSYKLWRLILPQNESNNYLIAGTYNQITQVVYLPSGKTIENRPLRFKFLIKYTYVELNFNGELRTRNILSDDEKAENPNNIIINAHGINSSGLRDFRNRFYSFKIYKQGKLIRNYQPCIRKSDNKAGFFDLVNQTFNPSIGSEDFIAGND